MNAFPVSDAYLEGYHAYKQGQKLSDNPFNSEENPAESTEWYLGYVDAEDFGAPKFSQQPFDGVE